MSNSFVTAAYNGDIDTIKKQIKEGIDVNIKGDSGFTALMQACHNGHIEIVKYLVENNANVNARNDYFSTALTNACFPADDKNKAKDIIKYLVSKGADPNSGTVHDLIPLQFAVLNNDQELLIFLLENGANINKCCKKNHRTVLWLTIELRFNDILKLLIKNGANINENDKYQTSILHHAVAMNNIEAVKIILEHGADANHKNYDGKTPYRIAKEKKLLNIMKILKPVTKNWIQNLFS